MDSAVGHPASPGWGCPIRTSPDHSLLATPRGFSQPSTSFIGSWCQGIHRVPLFSCSRHSFERTPTTAMQFSRYARAARPPETPNGAVRVAVGAVGLSIARGPVSQSSTAWAPPRGRSGRRWDGLRWCKRHRIPRKEVIQPQLPLRLPCYDFTPVTDSTFDRSLPCGLGHGLRASPASVV